MKTVIVILVSVLFLTFAACTDIKTDNSQENNVSSPESGTTATTPEKYTSDLPGANFAGSEFRVLGIDPNTYNACLDFDFTEATGDVLKDAVYKRNRMIEERYNMVFKSDYLTNYWDTTEAIKNMCLAGTDEYEMIMLINRDAYSAALSGYLTPLEKIPYLDITKPWYLSEVNNQFTIGGKKFLAYSDECLNLYGYTVSVLFNKDVINDYNLENPYELVNSGKWTWDKFCEMATSVITDVNGDNKYTSNDDIFGVISESDMFFPSIWIGSGVRTVEKDSDDIPQYTAPSNEKLLGLLDTIVERIKPDGFYMNSFSEFGGKEESRTEGSKHFVSGHSLFRIGCLIFVLELRNMESDFGILPIPKYDEAQQNYISRMIDGWLHVIPVTNTTLDMTGIIMESLAVESKNEVIPVFFEIALKNKYSRDEESVAMLDLLFNHLTVDLGDTVWQSTIRYPITGQIDKKQSGFASTTEKLTSQVEKLISDTLKAVNE